MRRSLSKLAFVVMLTAFVIYGTPRRAEADWCDPSCCNQFDCSCCDYHNCFCV